MASFHRALSVVAAPACTTRSEQTNSLHVVLALLLVELALLLSRRILILLVLGDEVVHVAFCLCELPSQSRYRHRGNGSSGNPEGNRIPQLPCVPHRAHYRSTLRPQCNDPSPNYCQPQFARRRSCQDGRAVQTGQPSRCPWCLAPGP